MQSLFAHPTVVEYFARLWREGRKFGLICTGISQNTSHMLANAEARDMVLNSEFFLLHKQSTADLDAWAEMLQLSATERGYIGDAVKPGEGLLISAGIRVPITDDFPKGPLYDLWNTKPAEVAEREMAPGGARGGGIGMAGPSEGGGMLEVVGAQRRDVLTAGDVAETERDALGNVSEGAGPLDEAGGPAATAKGRPSRPDAPEGGLGDKLSQPAGDRRAAAAMRSRVDAAKLGDRPGGRLPARRLGGARGRLGHVRRGACGQEGRGKAAAEEGRRKQPKAAARRRPRSAPQREARAAPRQPARPPRPSTRRPRRPRRRRARRPEPAGSKGAASAIAGAVSGAAPALLGAVAGIVAFVACALAVAQLLSALFGFWDDAASKQGLEGLPPYITYEMVEAALECQEEYGHPAGCTIAQIIQESGQGDRMSQLAERDHNLFGMKWWSGYAGCPEVAGKANWATSEEYVPGEHTQITASFIRFTGDGRVHPLPQQGLPAGGALLGQRPHPGGDREARLGQDGRGAQGRRLGDRLVLRRVP